jgi:hypothetical protein
VCDTFGVIVAFCVKSTEFQVSSVIVLIFTIGKSISTFELLDEQYQIFQALSLSIILIFLFEKISFLSVLHIHSHVSLIVQIFQLLLTLQYNNFQVKDSSEAITKLQVFTKFKEELSVIVAQACFNQDKLSL